MIVSEARAALANMVAAVNRLAAIEDAAGDLLAVLDNHDSFRVAMAALSPQDAERVRLARLALTRALRWKEGDHEHQP